MIVGLISLVFLVLFLVLRKKYLYDKFFESKYNQFNKYRINPISKELYQNFFELEYRPVNFMGQMFCFKIKDANHRNGDELVENTLRDAKSRIKDHLKISNETKSSIVTLGYDFKDKTNLIKFIRLLSEVSPSKGMQLSFPVNSEWFIFQKDESGKIGVSYKNI